MEAKNRVRQAHVKHQLQDNNQETIVNLVIVTQPQ